MAPNAHEDVRGTGGRHTALFRNSLPSQYVSVVSSTAKQLICDIMGDEVASQAVQWSTRSIKSLEP